MKRQTWIIISLLFFLAVCGTVEVRIDVQGTATPGKSESQTPIGQTLAAFSTRTNTLLHPTNTLPALEGDKAIAIAAGYDHSCAVMDSGQVKCWGKNDHGQLGNGTWEDSNVPVDVVGIESGARLVVAGWGHTCAKIDPGSLKCWGYNKHGELGNGANTDSNTPVDVQGIGGDLFTMAAGDDHTCALHENRLYCWGYNLYGQLGDGSTIDRNSPEVVNGLEENDGDFLFKQMIAAGWGHTCAMSFEGSVKCWGNNHYGQMGIDIDKENFRQGVYVSGLKFGAIQISSGGGHTCALTKKALIMCWGNNQYGQLGDGSTVMRRLPALVEGLHFKPVSVVSGRNHSCAMGQQGELACWGWNFYGQLGNGGRVTSPYPVVAGELKSGVRSVALGWGHTCVITESGGVQCWGLNDYGQVGDGTTTDAYLPVDVVGLTGRRQ